MLSHETTPHDEGFYANQFGRLITSNPYPTASDNWWKWATGWNAANAVKYRNKPWPKMENVYEEWY